MIFRWQAVTFDTPQPEGGSRGEHPVSFEIELQRDGDIIIRYGEGNDNVKPIVGISGGERESYFVGSHSSENSLINLGNAATVMFTQPPCSYSLSSTTQTVSANGFSGTVSVDTGGACTWTATSNVSWIGIITDGSNHFGSGIATFNVIANQSAFSRSGTLTIAGQTFNVNQAGVECSYMVGTTVQGFPASGGLSGTSVITADDCPWSATATAPWITITAGASGSGNGGVNFSVAANTNSSPRTGSIIIADKSVSINQAGISNPIDDTQTFVYSTLS